MRFGKILCVALGLAILLAMPAMSASEPELAAKHGIRKHFNFSPVTQGPFWPPGIVLDEHGDYIVIGNVLTQIAPGVVIPVPGAALVSKNTVPPLDENGREDFSNPLGAPYDVIRPLDLSPGSPDLDMVLYASSFGPIEGDFGGGPRMPKEGENAFNLNQTMPGEEICPELFPAASQLDFIRESFPLHQVPIYGFRGDGVAYDNDTGAASPAQERPIDVRSSEPITLGRYLDGERRLTIRLTDWDHAVGAFTAAQFNFRFRGLLPNAVYHVSLLRTQLFDPRPNPGNPTHLTVSNMFVTDERGNAQITRTIPNPVPDPATDDAGLRVIGAVGAYHSDMQNWGGCPGRYGSSVDTHAFFNSFADGLMDFTDFVTKAAP